MARPGEVDQKGIDPAPIDPRLKFPFILTAVLNN
jgi:hypothetical protein